MQQRVLKILEYDIILQLLTDKALSEMGKELACQLEPAIDYAFASTLCEQTKEACYALAYLGRSPVDIFVDTRESLKRSKNTLSLSQKELLDIAKGMRTSRLCKDALNNENITGHLNRHGAMLHSCRATEEEVLRCIISAEEMADTASVKLATLRRQIKSSNDKMRDKLYQLINNKTFKLYLQEPIITLRNGRYVIPVKAEHRGSVQGLLHDQSSSGATVFIEPMAVVEIGNQIKQLHLDEQEEIERILAALTSMCADNAEQMYRSLEVLAELDLIFAKAKLATSMKAVMPKLNDNGFIRVLAGRHPLIDPNVVVPIDIWFGKDFKTLIITGPNTGGKTVTLKTVGLFALMAQSGLFVPAADGVEFPVFEEIFADIGDEQSIQQSLSTFSSHMKNIVNLLDHASDKSLVLLDELGSGTDPIEGAALAMAILEDLHARKTVTLATTHYSELKAFAITKEGMENACMEFDVQTLRPTFRLFIGIPGKSNAFEISKKLGLAQRIIDNAQTHLASNDIRFEDIISSAQSQRKIAEQEMENAKLAREDLLKLRKEAEEERKNQEQFKEKQLKKAKEEAKAIVLKAKDEAESIIKKLKAAKTDGNVDRVIQETRDVLREKERSMHLEEIKKEYGGDIPKSVNIGDTVFVISLDTKANVISKPDSRGEVTVQAGILKLNVKLKDLRTTTASAPKKATSGGKSGLASRSVLLELDVRGFDAEEALMEVDRYLDDASIAHLNEVSIIHGKGSGVLRSAIGQFLRSHRHVKSHRLGTFGEGENGVTFVILK